MRPLNVGGVGAKRDTMTCLETLWLEALCSQIVHDKSVETFGYCSMTAEDAGQSKAVL